MENMFTGLIEAVVPIHRIDDQEAKRTLTIEAPNDAWAQSLVIGDSIAVSGACLTVVALDFHTERPMFSVEVVAETLAKTKIGSWTAGTQVNVERALALGDRLGGHWVQGHVDGVVRVEAIEQTPWTVTFCFDSDALLVPQGSITLDGVSLTVAGMTEDRFRVALIPHTLEHTTLGQLCVGDVVHVEYDVIGKYVAQYVAPYRIQKGDAG